MTTKPKAGNNDKAKKGKLSRLEPREQTYFVGKHGGVGSGRRPIDNVLGKLREVTQSSPGQWSALCPAHGDSSPSLSVGEGDDGRVLLTCHSGCEIDEILEAIGLEQRDLFPNHRQHYGRNGQPKDPPRRPNRKTATKHGAKNSKKKAKTTTTILRTAPGAKQDWAAMAKRYKGALPKAELLKLAKKLRVEPESLRLLDVGWRVQADGPRFTFPEFNGLGQVIGISTRPVNGGKKKVVDGSKRGLYIPPGWQDRKGPIYVVEGASDTATLVTLGLAGVGRPSATGGVDFLADLLADVPSKRPIVVVAEYDMKADGSWPGLDGARRVAKQLSTTLGRVVRWALPPGGAKDIRAWLQQMKVEQND